MISCSNCGTDNLDGSEYCDECGVKLDLAPYQPPKPELSESDTFEGVPPPAPPSFTTSTSIPKPATPARDPNGGVQRTLVLSSRSRTEALKSDGSAVKGKAPDPDAKLVLERGGRVGKEFAVNGVETNIGRWDADSGIFPDVDLDQDDPEAKVSRRHARIIKQNGQYYIEDLGSTNGTFLNRGRRLMPGHRQVLQNGDEIIVGKTFLKFHIV